jgi:group I intron endonuclease
MAKEKYRAGIYNIYCTVNGKQYVGSSNDIQRRWGEHRRDLRAKEHHCPHLQNAWNKYGENAFIFNVIEHVIGTLTREGLIKTEQIWIDANWPDELLFNSRSKAESNLGRKVSEETRKKLSAALMGRPSPLKGIPLSEEHRKNVSLAKLGKPQGPRSEETRKKISVTSTGRKKGPMSEAQRQKLSAIRKGKQSWNKGKPHTEAHKQALKEAWILRKQRLDVVA